MGSIRVVAAVEEERQNKLQTIRDNDFLQPAIRGNVLDTSTRSVYNFLKDKMKQNKHRAQRHRQTSNLYTLLHYFIGFPQIILTIILTAIGDMNTPGNNPVALIIGVIASILSLANTFFNIKQQSEKHKTCALQYEELNADCSVGMYHKENLRIMQRLMNEKLKFIKSYEPSFCESSCLNLCC